MKYAPSSAASCLVSQGKATTPHGPGGMPPKPMDSVGKGAGMGYHPAKAASCLDDWDHKAPYNGGEGKGRHKY